MEFNLSADVSSQPPWEHTYFPLQRLCTNELRTRIYNHLSQSTAKVSSGLNKILHLSGKKFDPQTKVTLFEDKGHRQKSSCLKTKVTLFERLFGRKELKAGEGGWEK